MSHLTFFLTSGVLVLIIFVTVKKHMLKLLLALEFFMLNTVIVMMMAPSEQMAPTYLIFMFFSLAVCEASIGVSILISLMRLLGNEHMSSLW